MRLTRNSMMRLLKTIQLDTLVKLKALAKIMESFKCVMLWDNAEQLRKLFKAYKRALNKNPDLEAEEVMKRVLKKDNVEDVIERVIEKQMDGEEDEEAEIED